MAADSVSVQRRLFIARKDPVSASARLDINGAQLGVPLSTLHANDQPGMMVVRTRMMRKQTIASPLIITTFLTSLRPRYTIPTATPPASAASDMRSDRGRHSTPTVDHPARCLNDVGRRTQSRRVSCTPGTTPDHVHTLVRVHAECLVRHHPARCLRRSSCHLSRCRSVACRLRSDCAWPQSQAVQQRVPRLQCAGLIDR